MPALYFTWGPAGVDALLSTTLANYSATLQDNIYTAMPLWFWLNEKGKKRLENGGTSVITPLMYGKNTTAAWYSQYGQLDTTPQEGITAAQWKWAQLAVSIAISRLEERQNTDEHRVLNLLKSKILQAEMAAIDRFALSVWSTTQVTNAIVPLDLLVGTTTSVGDISGSTYTWWQSTVTASGSFAAQGLKDMKTLYNTLSKYMKNTHPDLVLCTQGIYESYEGVLQPSERFTDSKEADGGFQALKFKGARMFFDENAIANQLFMLNSKYLELVVDKETDLKTGPFIRPENQDAKVAQILWMGALATNNRRMLGKLTGVTS